MPDQAMDTYEVVDSKGNIEYNFEGIIKAFGLSMAEGNAEREATALIKWLREGLVKEGIYGYAGGSGQHNLMLEAFGELFGVGTGGAVLRLTGTENPFAALDPRIIAFINEGVGTDAVTIIGKSAISSFPRLLTAQKRIINFGIANGLYAGATSVLDFTVSHGLGTSPSLILVTADSSVNGGGLYNIIADVTARNAVNFTVRTSISDKFEPAKNVALALQWLAIS